MRETALTKRDRDFMELGKKVQEVIKTPAEWKRFKQYTDFYYKKLPSMQDYRPNKLPR